MTKDPNTQGIREAGMSKGGSGDSRGLDALGKRVQRVRQEGWEGSWRCRGGGTAERTDRVNGIAVTPLMSRNHKAIATSIILRAFESICRLRTPPTCFEAPSGFADSAHAGSNLRGGLKMSLAREAMSQAQSTFVSRSNRGERSRYQPQHGRDDLNAGPSPPPVAVYLPALPRYPFPSYES